MENVITANQAGALVEEVKNIFADFEKRTRTELDEIKKSGHADPLLVESIEKQNSRMDDLQEKIDAYATKANRRMVDEDPKDVETVENRVFTKSLRYNLTKDGDDVLDAEEKAEFAKMRQKSLSVSTDTRGGILVPEDFRTRVIERIAYYANLAALVSTEQTSRDNVRFPRTTHKIGDTNGVYFGSTDIATSAFGVVWEDETETGTETNLDFGSISIPVRKARTKIRISKELTEDSVINIIDFVANKAAERFAQERDYQITKGPGGRYPSGILTNGSIPTVNSGSGGANTLTYDGLVDTWTALPPQYAKNATWMASRSTVGAIRKMKDGGGHSLWEPSMTAGNPSILLGSPLIQNLHMPSVGVAGAKALAYGDWKMAYMMVSKVGMSVQRLDELHADTDEIAFYFRERWGGDVVGEWAARFCVMS